MQKQRNESKIRESESDKQTKCMYCTCRYGCAWGMEGEFDNNHIDGKRKFVILNYHVICLEKN